MLVTKKFKEIEKQLIDLNYNVKNYGNGKLFYKYTYGNCRIDISVRDDGKIVHKAVYLIDFEVKSQTDIENLQNAFDKMQKDFLSLKITKEM